MQQLFTFKIGKVYFGSTDPFAVIKVYAYNVRDALNLAANYLRPNHLQTLTVIGQPTVEFN